MSDAAPDWFTQEGSRARAYEFMMIAARAHRWKDGKLHYASHATQSMVLHKDALSISLDPQVQIARRHLDAFIAEYYGQEQLP